MNQIAAMSDVEFAIVFFAASLAWMLLVWLAGWLAEHAAKKIRNRRINHPAHETTMSLTRQASCIKNPEIYT